jgi:hypothetical protein
MQDEQPLPDPQKVPDVAIPEPAAPVESRRAAPAAKEMCREVERALEKEPGDRVKCAHLFGDYYRCNWWSSIGVKHEGADYDWSAFLTDHIRRSSFLKVTITDGKITVQEVPAPAVNHRSGLARITSG